MSHRGNSDETSLTLAKLRKLSMSEIKGKTEKTNGETNGGKFSRKDNDNSKASSSKKPKRKVSKTKRKEYGDKTSKTLPNQNNTTEIKETNRQQFSDIIQTENVMTTFRLDPDVLRWENPCENAVDEMRRIEVYKANRRLRYKNANNTKLALLALKERK